MRNWPKIGKKKRIIYRTDDFPRVKHITTENEKYYFTSCQF